MRTRGRRAAAVLLLLAAAWSAAGPTALVAASPSPEPSAAPSIGEQPPDRPVIQAWLDAPAPTEAAPGDEVTIGATLWDAAAGAVIDMGATIFLRAVSADPAVEPIEATAIKDWPGHYRGTVTVPPGGLGVVQFGTAGTLCENDVCRRDDWVFELAGDGPPPDAPITSLAEARIDVDPDAPTAGQPADLGVVLTANADWPSIRLPNVLVVRAREPRGPNVATASLRLADRSSMAYAGSITIPQAGDLILEAAIDDEGGDATRFGTSMTPVTVDEAAGGQPAPGPAGQAEDEGLPPVVLVLLALVAIVGVGVVLAGFRSGGR